ncbi:MAG: potassium channel family protein [Oryzihumus sp.]
MAGPRRRHPVVGTIVRSTASTLAVLGLYFAAPLSRGEVVISLWLLGGLVLVGVLLVWQVRSIMRSPYPRLRAIEAVCTTLPLFLVICAAVHFLIEAAHPGSYSQDMSRMDAMYYVVTVFATVGFGDITPVSETARVVTTLQMVGDLVFVGVIARVLLGAIQEGLRRQGRDAQPFEGTDQVPLGGSGLSAGGSTEGGSTGSSGGEEHPDVSGHA